MIHFYLKKVFTLTFFSVAFVVTAHAQFTQGRLVVLQVGDGSAALSSAATPVILKEFTTSGTAGISVPIPITGTARLTISGTSTSDGQMTLSADGKFITVAGYDAAGGTAAVTGTTSATVNRVINTIDGSTAINRVATTSAQFSANNFRSAVKSSTNDYWGAGGNSGTYYFGTTSTAAAVQTTTANTRVVNIFNGNLYYCSSSGTSGIFSFSGLPVSTSAPSTLIATGTGSSPYAFSINAAGNVAYIADDRATIAGGIQKWTFNGSAWALAYTFSSGTNIGCRGLTVDYSGANPILFAVTTDNKLVSFTDAGSASASSLISTAAANTAYRGVTFAPLAPPIPSVNLSVSANAGTETAQTIITVTATASSAVVGSQTVNLAVTGTNITTGDYTLSNNTITIANGATTGSVTFTVVDDALPEATETAILTISNPSSGITLGSPVTQNIVITDNDNTAPVINMDVAATTNYIDSAAVSSPSSPFGVSAVINDPTGPAQTLGIDFTISDNETPATGLTVTATSSNVTVVPTANILVTGTAASRNVKIIPAAVGYSTITIIVNDGTASTSYILNYASSAASVVPASTRFHTGTSDASTAVFVDDNYMLVGDDENQGMRLYNRQNSGLPVNSFDFSSLLNLTDVSGGIPREVDIEASTRIGNRIYWLGSHSNAANGNTRPNRNRLFATDITGAGATTNLTYVGRYDGLKTDLLNWDATNAHGLGANYFGLTASATTGLIPEAPAGNGFNIEGLTMAPDGTTAYICFRAPIEPTTDRTKALIVSVTNFTSLVAGNPTAGPATFGAPIQLNLGGRGIREIKKNAGNEYLIIAGPHDGATGIAPKDFRLYTWTGNPNDLPVLRTADITSLNAGGSFESIVDLPNPLTNTSQIQVLVDNGDAVFYGDGIAAKDLSENKFKKFRSDTLTLGTPIVITTGSISGSPLCLGAGISVPYIFTGNINAGNTFTAQLSNASGSFENPVTIGTLNSILNTGNINATIPSILSGGSVYRIRVISSNPGVTGNDNGADIAIGTAVATIATTNQNITQNVADNSFEAGPCINLITNVFPTAANPVTGNVNAKVWIESAVIQNAGRPAVQRHYEITPTTGTTGRVTLYFTQPEFTNFNNDPASANDLPSGPSDAIGKANLKILKYAGVSSDGSGLPASYTGAASGIDPLDSDIIWNATANRWEVSFDVTGFSGFFVQTDLTILPIRWLSVIGSLNAQKQVVISWKVQETNVANYSIEKSIDGRNFTAFANINSTGDGENNYQFTEQTALQSITYYRIKQIDRDNRFSYSPIIKLADQQNSLLAVYPNPVNDVATVAVGYSLLNTKAQLTDLSGKILQAFVIKQSLFTLNISNYASGIYLLRLEGGQVVKIIKH